MAHKNPPNGHPLCRVCDMGMVVVDGYDLDPQKQTLECLRCGHIEKPARTIEAEYRRPA
jgi:23S rRNA C2498 (ribose-2'-O)-methylase RlmM